jgi:hypothetical protein
MSVKDIVVHVEATPASRARLRLAASLARRFDARLDGLPPTFRLTSNPA